MEMAHSSSMSGKTGPSYLAGCPMERPELRRLRGFVRDLKRYWLPLPALERDAQQDGLKIKRRTF